MRHCPVCQGMRRNPVVNKYDPAGRRGDGRVWCLYQCSTCSMLYVDALAGSPDVSQAWFDNYYLSKYTTDDKPYSDVRLNSLADLIASCQPKGVLDIGGTDGELQYRLALRGVHSDSQGVGAINDETYDAVVLSHTLEHIYDVPSMMRKVKSHMLERLFIEGPVWLDYDDLKFDAHWQHVNKFRPQDLESLMTRNGLRTVESCQISDYREYKCWRIVARYA